LGSQEPAMPVPGQSTSNNASARERPIPACWHLVLAENTYSEPVKPALNGSIKHAQHQASLGMLAGAPMALPATSPLITRADRRFKSPSGHRGTIGPLFFNLNRQGLLQGPKGSTCPRHPPRLGRRHRAVPPALIPLGFFDSLAGQVSDHKPGQRVQAVIDFYDKPRCATPPHQTPPAEGPGRPGARRARPPTAPLSNGMRSE